MSETEHDPLAGMKQWVAHLRRATELIRGEPDPAAAVDALVRSGWRPPRNPCPDCADVVGHPMDLCEYHAKRFAAWRSSLPQEGAAP